MSAQTEDKYVLRLPDGMRDILKASAKANGRSLNAEIIHRLANPNREVVTRVISVEDARLLMEERWARERAEQAKRVCFDLPEPVKPAPQPSQSEAAA